MRMHCQLVNRQPLVPCLSIRVTAPRVSVQLRRAGNSVLGLKINPEIQGSLTAFTHASP